MRTNNWKWIILFIAIVLTMTVMIWKSHQRIRKLDKQLNGTPVNQNNF